MRFKLLVALVDDSKTEHVILFLLDKSKFNAVEKLFQVAVSFF